MKIINYFKQKMLNRHYVKYPVVSLDSDGYFKVFQSNTKTNIVLHPSTKEFRRVEVDKNGQPSQILVEKTHYTVQKNIHAVRCGCPKCNNLMTKLLDQMESTGVEIVDSKDPKAIEKSLNRLKNRSYDKNSMPDKGEFIGE